VHDESRSALWRTPGFGGLSSDRQARFRGTDRASTAGPGTINAKDVTFEGGMKCSESLKYIEYADLGITDLFETRVGKVNLCGTNGYIQ
jgi:hypothetical protein